MGYHVVDPVDLDVTPDRPCERRSVSEAAGLDNLALNRYRAEPGEMVPLAYHVHAEQEEAFLVTSGELRVETPEGEKTVPAGAAFVAEAESPHRAYNPDDAAEPVELWAVGAPPVDDVRPYEPDEGVTE